MENIEGWFRCDGQLLDKVGVKVDKVVQLVGGCWWKSCKASADT